MATKYRYIVVTEDGEVSGSNDEEAVRELAGDMVVLEVESDGAVSQLAEGENLEIGQL